MKNRLPYDTIAGNLSEAGTYEQLREHLILAREACLTLGHYRTAQDDKLIGQGWMAVAEMLKLVEHQITGLATKRIHTSIGFKQ